MIVWSANAVSRSFADVSRLLVHKLWQNRFSRPFRLYHVVPHYTVWDVVTLCTRQNGHPEKKTNFDVPVGNEICLGVRFATVTFIVWVRITGQRRR